MKIGWSIPRGCLCVLLGACVGGCWAPTPPATELSINPVWKTVKFHDSKDNHILLENAEFNKTDGSAKIGKLEIDNNASRVIDKQIQQMVVWNTQMQTANEALRHAIDAASGMIKDVAPLMSEYMRMRQTLATDDPDMAKLLDALNRLRTPPAPPAPAPPPPPVIILPPPPPAAPAPAPEGDALSMAPPWRGFHNGREFVTADRVPYRLR